MSSQRSEYSAWTSLHTPLLGTDVIVRIDGADSHVGLAEDIDDAVVAEIERLESIISRYQPDSPLERWKRGELAVAPPEFIEVMRRAVYWRERTAGLLDPRAGRLTECWRSAASAGSTPTAEAIEEIVALLARPGFDVVDDGTLRRLDDVTDLDLHAFGKGWIVDRAIDAVDSRLDARPDLAVMVIAGGDVGRTGAATTVVSIDDPLRRRDNAPPLDRIRVGVGGLATSGTARRGIDDEQGGRVSHIFDPRTGRPAVGTCSVSVLASSCEAADAWATAFSLMPPASIVAEADAAGVGVLAVTDEGELIDNDRWRAARVR